MGLHTIKPIQNLGFGFASGFPNFFAAIGEFISSLKGKKVNTKHFRIGRTLRIIFLPFFIIMLFVGLYSMGSSFFSNFIGSVFEMLGNLWNKIMQYISFTAILVSLLGLLFGAIHVLSLRTNSFSEIDAEKSDSLTRIRRKVNSAFRNLDLTIEYKSGVFLFSTLSILLMMLLTLEIKNIWLNFEWNGELLKGMVHEGTYILIAAILISMAITLYYFRQNLNFYKKNKSLKYLAYSWIGLNALLVVSVLVRNAHYIQHFGLAYKRIGVLFFLVLCLAGLVTLVIKIANKKSVSFVLRINVLVAYCVLVLMGIVNWDNIIAQYNFSHYKTAFIHLPFMAELSDKALPYLKLTDYQIEEIENKQVENIPLARKGYFKDLDYKNKIEQRIANFNQKKEKEHWLESVWSEDRAYHLLKNKK
jgi:hypothetical protein